MTTFFCWFEKLLNAISCKFFFSLECFPGIYVTCKKRGGRSLHQGERAKQTNIQRTTTKKQDLRGSQLKFVLGWRMKKWKWNSSKSLFSFTVKDIDP